MSKIIYDSTTSNYSFLQMFLFLKNKGIKNCKFFLALYDRDLMKVDPHSKNLSPIMQAKVIKECYRNRWYFYREVVRIPIPSGYTKYELNRGNLAQAWCSSKNLNSLLMLPRQQGKTIGAVTDDVYNVYFGSVYSNELYFNKSLPDSINNLKRFKDIRSLLPEYIKNILIDVRNDTDNEKEIYSTLRNNSIKVQAAPNDAERADKAGRGATVPYLYLDEFAFMKYNDIVYEAAAPANSKASEVARKNGAGYGKKITTTPNDIAKPESKYCREMMNSACQFDESMYDITDDDELREYIHKNSSNDFVNIIFYWRELGLSEEWYDKQCRDLNNNKLKIKREIDLEWTQSNDNSIFNESQLDLIRSNLKPVKYQIKLNRYYTFKFYENIHPEISYILGVDVSGGLENDNTAIAILHPLDLHIVGVFKNSKITGPELVSLLETLVLEFLPNSIIVIERNSYGLVVIQTIQKDKNNRTSPILKNLYWELKEVKGQKTLSNGRVIKGKTKKRVYGHNTDVHTRPIMVDDILMTMVEEEYDSIVSEELYKDIKSLIRNSRNKIEHDEGEHDDVLFSTLIARYTALYGSNYNSFKKNYGSKSHYKNNANQKNIKRMKDLKSFNTNPNMYNQHLTSSLIEEGKKLENKKNKFSSIFDLNK